MVLIFEKSKHLCPVEKQAGESPTPIWGDGRFTSAGNADCKAIFQGFSDLEKCVS